MKLSLISRGRHRRILSRTHQGFTLIELLVAGVIGAIVILVTWSGLISAMSMSQAAEARSARQAELNRALDFMTNEIRMARSINQSAPQSSTSPPATAGASAANPSLTLSASPSLTTVVQNAGVNLANLGSYGTLALYLERPITNAPALCPVGGPNGGAPPPTPTDFDPIVYDIRPSSSGWLQPRMLTRYGRVLSSDGTINPCNNPVASDPIIDALSTTMGQTPTCSGTLSGDGGFYSCVDGKKVDLFFQSDVAKTEVKQVSSTASSRLLAIAPLNQASSPSTTSVSLNLSRASNAVSLSWTPPSSANVSGYNLTGFSPSYALNINFTPSVTNYGTDITFIPSGENVCYSVIAQLAGGSSTPSNPQCLVK